MRTASPSMPRLPAERRGSVGLWEHQSASISSFPGSVSHENREGRPDSLRLIAQHPVPLPIAPIVQTQVFIHHVGRVQTCIASRVISTLPIGVIG